MDPKKKIFCAMIEAGGGHRAPAEAVRESLTALYPDVEVRLLDFMREAGCAELDAGHKRMWEFMLAHPLIARFVHHALSLCSWCVLLGLKIYARPYYDCLTGFLEREKPDLVFSTHFLVSIALTQLRRREGYHFKVVTFLTDVFYFSNLWVNPDADHLIVASEQAWRQAVAKGIPPERVSRFAYPIRPSFFRLPRSPQVVKEELGLDGRYRTLLITLGGESKAPVEKYLKALRARAYPLNVILVTGNNRRLKENVEAELGRGQSPTRIVCLGYVTNMNELLSVSDFCFVKPGSATAWEVFSLGKPVLFHRSAQLGEDGNIDFARKHGIGRFVGASPSRFLRSVEPLLNGSGAEYERAYQRLEIRNGADEIARFLMGLLDRHA